MGWRIRAGLVASVAILGFIALWPTISALSGHSASVPEAERDNLAKARFPCPSWLTKPRPIGEDKTEARNDFRLVAGLDLRGGLRLVYTVDVDEAIKDKRDRYYEDMRTSLSKVFGLHSGDEKPSEETLVKLRDIAKVEAPKRPANSLRITLTDKADPNKIDTRFLDQFRGDLTFAQSADKKSWEFSIKEESETQIRERAVNQAREIILRRVDEFGPSRSRCLHAG